MSDLMNNDTGGLRKGEGPRIAALTRWCAILAIVAGMVVLGPLGTRTKAAQGARKASPSATAIALFKVSVMKSVALPGHEVGERNDPFLGTESHTHYNMALVLEVTSTAPGTARLTEKHLKVQVVDDRNARHDALGYTPIEIGQPGVDARMQTDVDIDKKTNVMTLKHIYTLSNGATVKAELVIDSAGRHSWAIELPAGKPTIVSCIFNIPSGRKAVQVALAGAKNLITLPATPQAAR